ncbi:hypothetical protein Aduo_012848 [Ancylostoma duodenale]
MTINPYTLLVSLPCFAKEVDRTPAVLLLASILAKYFECWRILLRCNGTGVTFTCDITAYLSVADDEITIAERCYAREEVFGWRSDCQRMIPGAKNYSSVERISLRKSTSPAINNVYQSDIQRCVSHKPASDDKRTVMKLEFDLDKVKRELDPCELWLRRDNMKCRVAVDYTNMMFRERLKISVVKKRSLLLFSNGCHL